MNTIVVTGAASGLGKAITNYYSKLDYTIIVADINVEAGQQLVNEINNQSGKAFFFECDVGSVESLNALAAFTESTTGACHILINNAGVASAGTLMETDEAEWQRLINLDLMSCVRGCKAFIPLLKQSSSAESVNSIVNVASLAGLALMPGMMTYNVAKAGVVALSESLRCELKADHIHVAAACPAYFKTNLTSSMISSDQETIDKVERWMAKSQLTADSVAKDIAEGIAEGQMLILSGKKLQKYYRILKWLYYRIINRSA